MARVLSLDYNPDNDPFDDPERRALRRLMSGRPTPQSERIRPLVRTRNGNIVRPRA
jgi:hypothetical protein